MDFTSIDKSQCGNSSNTNDHLVKCHWFYKSNYILGCKVTYSINKAQASTLDKYTISLRVNLDAIEALI